MFVGLYKKTNSMDAPGFASPIRTYRQNLSKMRESNDPNGSETNNLCSLGVVDLDLTVCPDVFGPRAFDKKMPVTRMLPCRFQPMRTKVDIDWDQPGDVLSPGCPHHPCLYIPGTLRLPVLSPIKKYGWWNKNGCCHL